MLVDVFAPEFRSPKNMHLRNFYIIVPPLVSICIVGTSTYFFLKSIRSSLCLHILHYAVDYHTLLSFLIKWDCFEHGFVDSSPEPCFSLFTSIHVLALKR